MTTPVGDLIFPTLSSWLTHGDGLNRVADAVLDVSAGALTAIDRDEFYSRKVVTHGQEDNVNPSEAAGQLVVTVPRVFLGQPGQEQFQLDHGAQGRFGFRTGVFRVRLTRPWPMRQDTLPIAVPVLDEARTSIFEDGYVVWSALIAWALGGIIHPTVQPRGNEIHVGPLQAPNPAGGQASWTCDVSILL